MRTHTAIRAAILLSLLAAAPLFAQDDSKTNPRLQAALKKYPDADMNGDGVLTFQEVDAYRSKLRSKAKKPRGGRRQNPTIFRPTAKELETIIELGRTQTQRDGLSFEQGTGLRVVMTGHSWVAPARKTLPTIAVAAGFDEHRQRSHTSGGGTGSANAIWLKEFGKYDEHPPKPILLPAITTGQWDVMTWGSYYEDKPEYYSQWIDVCLQANPGMEFCIQDGWPRHLPSYRDMPRDKVVKAIENEQEKIQGGMYKMLYRELEEKYPGKVRIIPASVAVVEMIRRFHAGDIPEFDCIDEDRGRGGKRGIYRDGGHLSSTSGMEQLMGYVYFGMLYAQNPEAITDYTPNGISKRLDETIREVAWKAITTSPYSRMAKKKALDSADKVK